MEARENVAKYLNSPESSIYHKSRILYGLSHAKDEIRKQNRAILVEGYMDLISLHQNGIKNVVAVSGTALTDEQIQLISRYTKNIILLFDADNAGVKASMRSIELLLKQDMEVRVITLPQGEDPDSYVNNYGRENFEEQVRTAKIFLEYQTAYYENLGYLEDPVKLTEVLKDLVKTLSLIKDDIKRSVLLKNISRKFNIRENLLEAELDKNIAANIKTTEIKEAVRMPAETAAREQAGEKEKKDRHIQVIERDLIKLLFEGDKHVLNFIFEHIHPEDMSLENDQQIVNTVLSEYFSDRDIAPSALLEKFSDETIQNYILELTFEKYSTSKRWIERNMVEDEKANLQKEAEDIVKSFLSSKIDEQIRENHKRIVTAENEGLRLEYMKNINELLQSKKEIGNLTLG